MGRASIKEDKKPFQISREDLDLSREEASEILGWISPEKIERIENEKVLPQPDEVLVMAKAYKNPKLCNYYCSSLCPIGKQYVPEIKVKDLSQIILEMLSSLNTMQKRQERLIEIAADGVIAENEIPDFVLIQDNLEKISIMVETLQLWSERMLATGAIDIEAYQDYKEKL